MKKRLLYLFDLLVLLCALTTVASAADWTYDPSACTLSSSTVVLKNVIANGTNLTIGNNQDFTGATLDLTGPITDSSGTETYTITAIADWDELAKGAFYKCSSLTSVRLPDSLTSIGYYAFRECSGLTSIDLPDSLKTIGYFAFSDCIGLTSLTLPDSVETIGQFAFSDCIGLTSIDLPDSVASIEEEAFGDCSSLTAFHVAEGNPNFSAQDGVLFNKDQTKLIQYPMGKGEGSYQVPAGVTEIGAKAFQNCGNLTMVTLPDGVTSIGAEAFSGCSGLTGITLPDGITSIGDSAFRGCSSLTGITLPDSVTTIGKGTFYGCSGLTSIDLPDGLETIGDSAFGGCSSLTGITLPDGITSIGNSVFFGCIGLTGITLPDGVTSIGDSAFSGCIGLTGITLPDGVTSIGGFAFSDCSGLTSIDLPDGLETIWDRAFGGCIGLTGITLPDGVTSIGDSVFYGCSGLTSIDLPDGLETIGDSVFSGCSGLTSIDLPDGLETIGDSAFSGCIGLTGITLPDGVTSIGDWAFSGCSSLTGITLPDGVTSIGEYAFFDCSSLTSITLPDGVTSIGEGAFYDCSSLTELVLLAQTPPVLGWQALYGVGSPLRIVVPGGSVEAYKQATDWVGYAASIEALSYGLTVATDSPSLEFPQGAIPAGVAFTITNHSNVTVSGLKVSLTDSGNFELDTSEMAASLAPNGTTTFTVTLRSGLAAGSYSTGVNVTSMVSGVPATASLTCTVREAAVYGISADTTVLDFGTVNEGYEAPAAKTVTITNAGNQSVTLTQPTAANYTLGALSKTTLAPADTATVTVRPNTGLAAGTYNETLTVYGQSGGYAVRADVELRFTVTRQSGGGSGGSSGSGNYGITVSRPAHGTVKLSHSAAVSGAAVTITVTPDEGYQLDTLTVTDSKGNERKLTEKGGGQYTFVMPSSAVTVKAVFIKIEAEPEPLPFTDVPETAWYADAVRYVYEHYLMNGTDAQKFSPDSTTSRSMIATILWRMAGSPVVNYAMDFSDVAQGQWYSEAIRWAASEGIVGGYGNGAFGTNDPITREQFAVMLYRFAQKQGYDVSVGENTNILSYADAFDVAEYAIPAMQWACGAGIVNGSGANLNPQGDATRAQAAAMLMRFVESNMQ